MQMTKAIQNNPNEAATWHVDDGNGEMVSTCETAEEAAQEYVDCGEWGMDEPDAKTTWITVHVWRMGIDDKGSLVPVDESTHTITLDPPEPDCTHADGHLWECPHALVGGIAENPGVWGHGGGVTIQAVCMRCGCGRFTDSWAQNMETGEQGLDSVRYEPEQYLDTALQVCDDLTIMVCHADDGGYFAVVKDEHGGVYRHTLVDKPTFGEAFEAA